MNRTKPILGFVFRFVFVFGLLIAPWPGWEETYARLLRKGTTAIIDLFGSKGIQSTIDLSDKSSITIDFLRFGSKGLVAFARNPTGDKTLDTVIYVGNRKQADASDDWPVQNFTFSSRLLAFLPTALTIALVLATAIGWRRRVAALMWGLLWIHVYISFLLWLMIISTMCAHPELGLFENSPFWQKTMSFLYECFLKNIGTHLITVVPIWILVTFRREDWVVLLGKDAINTRKAAC